MSLRDSLNIVLLWLAGNALRLTILAVPPLLPLIQRDLNLSGTQIAILTGLPVVLLAVAALPGSLLIARYGARHTLIAGFVLAAIGGAFRGASTDIVLLYGMTIIMGAGIAVMQTTLPSLVRQWVPGHIALGSAVYTNGLLVGEIIPVAFTLPLIAIMGASWGAGLAIWSIPVALCALAVLIFAPAEAKPHADAPPPVWWPNWQDRNIWRLGFVLAASNTVYFGTNAFIPGHLTAAGRLDLIGPALTSLNLTQIPASLLLIAFNRHIERRAWPFLVFGILMLIGLAGVVAFPDLSVLASAGLVGFCGAGLLSISLALPPTLAASADVGRTTAAMFAIGYLTAVILSLIGGMLWDVMADVRFAFLPIMLGGIPLLFLAPTIPFKK